MRTTYLIRVLILIGLAVGVAKADSVTDPLIVIHGGGCCSTPYDGSGPLMLSFGNGNFLIDFKYTGTSNLNELDVQITGVPLADANAFYCASDVFVECSLYYSNRGIEFVFFKDPTPPTPGSPVTCQDPPPGEAGITCNGFVAPGHDFSAAVVTPTPEPATIVFLGTGLLGFIAKRRKASRAA